MKFRGFTLIELLVVVAIIGVLATVVLASLNSARTKGNIAAAKSELNQLSKILVIVNGETGQTLRQITNSICTECSCRTGNIKNTTGACYTDLVDSLTDIKNVSNSMLSSVTGFDRDPWGSPYLLDENQLENGSADCRADGLASAGPDGAAYTADDIRVYLPPVTQCENQPFTQYSNLTTPL